MRLPAMYGGLVVLAMLAIPFKPFDAYFLIKTLPIVFLATWAWFAFMANIRMWLVAALSLSALGDILLALDFNYQFVLGLSAFLLAQLAYGVIYFRQLDRTRLWRVGLALVFPVVSIGVFAPYTGDLLIAVALYTLAIGFMLAMAWGHKAPSIWIALGASCFILSDSLIAINKFIIPLPAESFWVMSTYYLAQGMMFMGLRQYWR